MKRLLSVALIVSSICFVGCGGENTIQESNSSKTEVVKNDGETSEKPQKTEKQKLKEIKNFLTSDIWNDGFCDISHYIGDGKNSTGKTMDLDFTIEQLGKAMETKKEYDEYIKGLDDSKFSDVKSDWEKLSGQIDILYGKLKDKKPVVGDYTYDFDTGLYSQYSDAFGKDIDKVE